MAIIERDFYQRSPEDQQDFLTHTWCNNCMAMDLGMVEPHEFEKDGIIYIEGKCAKCGDTVTTEIAEEDESDWEN